MDQIINNKVTVKIKNEIQWLMYLGVYISFNLILKQICLTWDAKTPPPLQSEWLSLRRSVSLWKLQAINRLHGCIYVVWWLWKEPLALIRFSKKYLIPKRVGITYLCRSSVLKISHINATISFLQEKYSSSKSIPFPSWLRESPRPVRNISVPAPSWLQGCVCSSPAPWPPGGRRENCSHSPWFRGNPLSPDTPVGDRYYRARWAAGPLKDNFLKIINNYVILVICIRKI